VPPSSGVEYGQPYGFSLLAFSCSRSVPIHFKPLLGIVTRKDFYFYFFSSIDAIKSRSKPFLIVIAQAFNSSTFFAKTQRHPIV
jgi:hypothetical protein